MATATTAPSQDFTVFPLPTTEPAATSPVVSEKSQDINNTNTSSSVNVGAIIGSVFAAIIIITAVILLARWKWRSQQQQKFKERFFSQRAPPSQLEMASGGNCGVGGGSSMIEHARAHTATTGSDSSRRFLIPVDRVEHGNVGQANVEQESET
ncbi:hypothetical protein HDU81_009613, partial [Chytriomyces hyalinus]